MAIKFIHIFFIVIGSVFSVYASPLKFYNINAKYGISVREVNSVCRDNTGFIWASSKNGILRLSEEDYRIYNLPYDEADVITVKLIFKNSTLIAYAYNGQIFSYNPVYDRFELMINLSRYLNDENFIINNLLIDDNGLLWISSSYGLYKFDKGELSLVDNTSTGRYLTTWFDQQHLLIAWNDGIWLYNINSLKKKCICCL